MRILNCHSAAKEASANFRVADVLRFIKGTRVRAVLSLVLTILAWGGVAFASLLYFLNYKQHLGIGCAALVGNPSVIRHDVLIDLGSLDRVGTLRLVLAVGSYALIFILSVVSLEWILWHRSQVARRSVGWVWAVLQVPILGYIFLFYWEMARFVAVYGVEEGHSLAFRLMFFCALVFLMGLMSLLIPKPKGWRMWKMGVVLLFLCAAIQAVSVVGIFAGAQRALATHPKPTKVLPAETSDWERTPVPTGRFWGLEKLVLGP